MIVASVVIAIIYFALKFVPIKNYIYDGFRYFIIGISCFTVIPLVLKKLKI